MCTIAFKGKGVKRIPKAMLQQLWKNNPDGAGYAIFNEDTEMWDVKKGFMKFEALWNSYKDESITKDTRMVVHFRIGTSGKEVPQLTHPFPVTNVITKMGVIEYSAKEIVFHNGIIGLGEKDATGFEWNDTCVAIRDLIYPTLPYIEDDNIFNFMVHPLESDVNRWLICKGTMVYQYGKWQEDAEGVEYSNEYWKKDRVWKHDDTQAWGGSIDRGSFGIPPYDPNAYRDAKTGRFDWDKWEKRGSQQSELPWNEDPADTVAPGDTQHPDEAIIVAIDAEGKGHAEGYDADRAIEFLCCPNCYQDKYLDNSPFSVGDTICLICGAVFDDMTGDIITFDHDIKAKFDDKVKEADNG